MSLPSIQTCALFGATLVLSTAAAVAAPDPAASPWRDVDGVAVPESPATDAALAGLDAALFLPRFAVDAALAPARASLYVYGRYRLDEVYEELFFNDARTFGVTPTVELSTSLGIEAGARVMHTDLAGRGESASARATFGPHRRTIDGGVQSGRRWGALRLGLGAAHQEVENEPFYGIGNAGRTVSRDDVAAGARILPFERTRAVRTEYRRREERVTAAGAWRPRSWWSAGGSLSLLSRRLGPSDDDLEDPPLDRLFDPTELAGYGPSRFTTWRSEFTVRLESLASPSPFVYDVVPTTGGVLQLGLGLEHSHLAAARPLVRPSLDAHHFWNLDDHVRVLVLRLYAEGITADPRQVPFVDLPRLGGADLLRGFDRARFRDRVAGLTSATYLFELNKQILGYLFTDVGRVWSSWRTIGPRSLHVGYGAGLMRYTRGGFQARFQVAYAPDGGLFFHLSFDRGAIPSPTVRPGA